MTTADTTAAAETQRYLEMLRRMLLIRYFDETAAELVERGELVGAVHTYIGEEAVAVGACAALTDEDYMTGNHRSHGHPIAKGGDVNRAMAELLGKRTGYCKGKGGSSTWPISASAFSVSPASSAPPCRWRPAPRWPASCAARTRW